MANEKSRGGIIKSVENSFARNKVKHFLEQILGELKSGMRKHIPNEQFVLE